MKKIEIKRQCILPLIVVISLFCIFFLPSQINADPNVVEYGSGTGGYPVLNAKTDSIDENSRLGSTATFTYTADVADIGVCNEPGVTCVLNANPIEFKYECSTGAENGGWRDPVLTSNVCWTQLQACYFYGTINEICTDFSGYDASIKEDYNSISHPQNGIYSTVSGSSCTPSAGSELCITEATGIITENSGGTQSIGGTDYTIANDDMYSIGPSSKGYIENPALGAEQNKFRLRYIERDNTQSSRLMMIPSAPSDYRAFMDNEPSNIIINEPACYPLRMDVSNFCRGNFAISPPSPEDGECNESSANETTPRYLCLAGISNNGASPADTTTDYNWTCQGQYGGTDEVCTYPKPVNGTCSSPSIKGQCASGDTSGAVAVGANFEWTCRGSFGGTDSPTCSIPVPVDGQCDNSVRNGCTIGTSNDAEIADNPTHYRWRCDGLYGGANSPACEILRPVDGVCDNSNDNSCAAGVANDAAVADTLFVENWRCDGQYGGANSGTCTIGKTCQPPPTGTDEHGTCGNAHGGNFVTTAEVNTAGRCLTGTLTAAAGSGPWTWTCAGIGAGTNMNCNAGATAVAGACTSFPGSHISQPANAGNGCTNGTIFEEDATDTATLWKWNCDGLNGGVKASCTATRTDPNSPPVANYDWYYIQDEGGDDITVLANDTDADGDALTISSAPTSAGGCNIINYGSYLRVSTPSSNSYTCNFSYTASDGKGGTDTASVCIHGPDATCTGTPIGACRSIPGTHTSQPATNTAQGCTVGTFAEFGPDTTVWKWRCDGVPDAPSTYTECTANRAAPACSNGPTGTSTNGTCGAAHGGTFASSSAVTSAQRCAVGSVISYTSNATSASWTCDGAGSGTNQNCSATISSGPTGYIWDFDEAYIASGSGEGSELEFHEVSGRPVCNPNSPAIDGTSCSVLGSFCRIGTSAGGDLFRCIAGGAGTWVSALNPNYATSPSISSAQFDANCGAVYPSACQGCTSFSAITCTPGAACNPAVDTQRCLINGNLCTMDNFSGEATVWDEYECQ